MHTHTDRHAVVLGSTGLIGRAVVAELRAGGIPVVAASRSGGRTFANDPGIAHWTVDYARLTHDANAGVDLSGVTEIYNCTGSMDLTMTASQAASANVTPIPRIVRLASSLPLGPRLVHVAGYRTNSRSTPALHAYTQSKQRSESLLRQTADELGVSWTTVNPCSVISYTNPDYPNKDDPLVDIVDKIWRGAMPVVPATATTFVPIISDTNLARFMVALPADPLTERQMFWLLDTNTPPLRELVEEIADALRVKRPVLAVAPKSIAVLPQRLTNLTPQSAEFLSEDTYPMQTTWAFTRRHGLSLASSSREDIERWTRHVVSNRVFRQSPAQKPSLSSAGSLLTFKLAGDRPRTVVFPGLPMDSVTWADVVEHLTNDVAESYHTAIYDLPGTGRTTGTGRSDWTPWLRDVMATGDTTGTIVGHSYGCAAALHALTVPGNQLRRLILVSPFFLQPSPAFVNRQRALVYSVLRLASPKALSTLLLGTPDHAASMTTVSHSLRRPGVAWRTAGHVTSTASTSWRKQLRAQLAATAIPVTVICGEDDPLSSEGLQLASDLSHVDIITVPGGHHMQITHPEALARAINDAARESLPPTELGRESRA